MMCSTAERERERERERESSGVKLPRARTKYRGPEVIKGPEIKVEESTKLNADFLLLE